MNETKFTPGPWFVSRHNDLQYSISSSHKGYEEKEITDEEDEANAKLIAAAPDMFDIISELYKYGMESGHKGVLFPQIEAAYLKVIA